MIYYIIHFVQKNKSAKILLPKTFKIKKISLLKGDEIFIKKHHVLKAMTTKKVYEGIHRIDIQINGNLFQVGSFMLE
jgi:hypothetical protein